ncbi:zinc finger protein 26-like isoform X1 [Planococcus citri]|uniref:zinc finger protein 26-like isoform X1 n=1 Tax=Planococcus citri TaxID=170843 RepID=UPI0031F97FD5
METQEKIVDVNVDGTFVVKTDAGELCRLCANTDNQFIPIFQGEGLEHNLSLKIETHLPIIKVTEADKLPLQICYQCASTLISWHNLYESCRVADKRLREIIAVDEKLYQEDDSCGDFADDFRDDYDDDTPVNLPTETPSTSNLESNTFKDNPTEIPTLSETKSLINETELEESDERSSAALEGEKWDPLILPPQQQTAAGATATNAEDRAKLVKSKKLGPLMRSYEGNDVIVLECDQCTAFFIDKNDYDKHRKSHENHSVGECAVEASFISVCGDDFDDVHLKTVDDTESAAKIRSKKKSSSNSPSKAVSPKGWRNSSRQKLRIKLGGNVVVKKTAKKVSTGTGRSSLSKDDSISVRGLSSSLSSQRRQSTKNVSYTEFDDSDGENDRKNVKRVLPDEFETRITKRAKDVKKRKCSEPVAFEMDSSEDEVKPGRGDDIIEVIEEMIIADRTPSKKNTRERRSTSDGEVRRKKPRLKRLRRGNDEDDDKGQTIYTCAHCLRKFRRKSNLKRHMSKLHFGKEKDDASDGSKWFTGYCCDICGEGLQVRSMMMAHRDVMHGRYPEIDWCKYQTSLARVKFCNECKKYFRGGKLFDEHICDKGKGIVDEERARLMKEAEDIKPSFFCYICNHCFKWKWDYRAHHENEHKEAPPIDWSSLNPLKLEFYCDKCCKAYSDEMVLNSHECTAAAQQTASDMAVKPFRCELCGSDYFWKSDFRRHMRTKHPKENYRPTEHDTIIYSCPYCEEKFSMKKRILHHMRKAHNINSDSPFVCVQCNKVFRRRDNLDRHNESYHPTLNDQEANKILSGAEIKINGEIAYHCEVCNRNMSNPNRFISHYRGHYSENKFTCDLCGKQAKTQHQLNTHIKNIHLNIRNYKCDICSKSFYTKQACEEHRRIHTGERPFSCEICGKTFVAGNALISHKRFHNDFYPHSCHMCPKKFKVRRSLINHIRTHTGERPFKCDLCTKTFNNSSQYSYHKKVTHSEARPFVCSLCGNCFKANKFLTRHMELHAIRTQIQTRKPNNPAHYTTSQIKTSPATTPSAAQPVASTTIAASHQQQQPVPQQHPPLLPQPANRVSVVEQTVSSAPIMTAQVQPVQHGNSGGAVYVKEVSPSTSATYRNDDLVAAAMYNLQRTGYENNTNEFARPVVAPAGCDINTMNGNKRNFTAADAYVTAASYALGNEDFKTNPGTVARPYNPPGQPPGNHSIATGKHMTWL